MKSHLASMAFVAVVLCGSADRAAAQTCTVSGSSVTLASGSCSIAANTTLNGSPGVHATTGAQITTNNVNINPFNGGSVGGLAETNGVIVFSSGSIIQGNWATAAIAQTGGQIIFQAGSTISPAFGGGGTALVANGANSQISATGLTLTMSGGGGNTGARAAGGGVITLNAGTSVNFTAGGGGNTGLVATGSGSQIVTNGATLTMPGGGGGDTGVRADTGASVALNGGSVTVQSNGGGETGLAAIGPGSSISTSGTAISVSNSGGGRGALVQNGASMSLGGGSLTTTGPGTFGVLLQAPGGITNTLAVNGTSISSAADAFAVQGGTANISTTNANAIGNNGILLSAAQTATVTMTNNASVLTGAILTDGSSTSNVAMLSGTTWNMTGNSNTTNLVNTNSSILISPPTGDPTLLASYKTLTTMNYAGTGGQIVLNTFLGPDGSPSDRLIISGGSGTGATTLSIHNTTGPGALTTGNGILVIDAINGGTTTPGAFTLTAPVDAGPYEYLLFRGSVDAGNPQAWYLRSAIPCSAVPALRILCPVPPEPPTPTPGPGPGPAPGPGPGPGPSPPPQPVLPDFRAETSLYAAIPGMALVYGRNLLDTLHERVGEEEDQRGAAPSANGWARLIGMAGRREADPLGIFGLGPTYRYDFVGIEAGHDLYRKDNDDGSRDHAGVYFALGEALGRVTHVITGLTGDSNFKGYSFAGYWTHFGASGWYLDGILQGTWYDVESSAHRGLPALLTNGGGVAGSLEAGYPFRFAGGFFIEPQAQVVVQRINLAEASDVISTVKFDNVDSVAGRIGARFGRTWSLDGGATLRTITAWIRPNLWHEFRGNPLTEFSSDAGFIPFRGNLRGTWGEINGGVSGQLNASTTLYANVSYESRFADRTFAYNAKIGARVNW